jgi:hypothetical protein
MQRMCSVLIIVGLRAVLFNIVPQLFDIVAACIFISAALQPWIAVIVFITLGSYIPVTIVLTEWRVKYRRQAALQDPPIHTCFAPYRPESMSQEEWTGISNFCLLHAWQEPWKDSVGCVRCLHAMLNSCLLTRSLRTSCSLSSNPLTLHRDADHQASMKMLLVRRLH